MVGVQTVQGASVGGAAKLHGSRPEATRRIALAVVEAIGGNVALRIGDRRHLLGVEVKEGEAVVQGQHQTAGGPLDDGTHRLAGGDRTAAPCRRIVDVEFVAEDVDPVDDLVLRVPQHPFTNKSPLLDDLFGYALFVHV